METVVMMTDLLIILFLAAMAVGWSLYLLVRIMASVSEYFYERRMRAQEARRVLEEKKWRSGAAERQAKMSRDYWEYLGRPRLDEDGNPEFYPPVH
jgi:hypothetical protein